MDVAADLHPEPADECPLTEMPSVAVNLDRVPALGCQLLEGAQAARRRGGRDDALLTEHREVRAIKPMHRLIGRHAGRLRRRLQQRVLRFLQPEAGSPIACVGAVIAAQ